MCVCVYIYIYIYTHASTGSQGVSNIACRVPLVTQLHCRHPHTALSSVCRGGSEQHFSVRQAVLQLEK